MKEYKVVKLVDRVGQELRLGDKVFALWLHAGVIAKLGGVIRVADYSLESTIDPDIIILPPITVAYTSVRPEKLAMKINQLSRVYPAYASRFKSFAAYRENELRNLYRSYITDQISSSSSPLTPLDKKNGTCILRCNYLLKREFTDKLTEEILAEYVAIKFK